MKKFNLKFFFYILCSLIVIFYIFINSIIGIESFRNFKSTLSEEHKYLIKKYFFPYKAITQLEYQISSLKNELKLMEPLLLDLEIQKTKDTSIKVSKSLHQLSNNKKLTKYKLNSGFYFGIHEKTPGSGYIDFYKDDIFVLSSRGVLAYRNNFFDEEEDFTIIKNNIDDFIGKAQYLKHRWYSLKDLLIFKNKIFISYTKEIKENCWNTSIIYAEINYEYINFNEFFSPKYCVHSIDNIDKKLNPKNYFNAHQSGGRIIPFDNNNILFSIGDYRARYLAQDEKSLNGKIIKINLLNNDHEIISMGHRNPQGLYFDKENNFILETEHGPHGGDEINLIDLENINKNKIPNYGWAIVSAGEHVGGNNVENAPVYEKYPLHKSHSEFGFIEPLKSFVPSIAISQITKIGHNSYVVSCMGTFRDGDKSLYFFELNSDKKISKIEQVKVNERIRDIRFKNNKLYLFLEGTASIGIIDL